VGASILATFKLVVGLGNPGPRYEGTRHNIGYELIDVLAKGSAGTRLTRKFDGLVGEIEIEYRRVLLLKPETFMNLSGRSVRQVVRFYRLELQDLLVVCDDLSLPLGKLRIRPGGSDGGQKGLRDIIAELGSDQFPRLRIGIGDHGATDAAEYVLSRFRPAERTIVQETLILAAQAVAVWVTQGIEVAMNRFNGPT
jgi:PTH1 family peptidyl-tRNA hydrolase